MKNCPYCAEEIQFAAIKCKHCNEWLRPINPKPAELNGGTALRTLRQQKGITIGKLSRISGVQSATLSRIENNKAIGSLKNYIQIAKALGFKLSELFVLMGK